MRAGHFDKELEEEAPLPAPDALPLQAFPKRLFHSMPKDKTTKKMRRSLQTSLLVGIATALGDCSSAEPWRTLPRNTGYAKDSRVGEESLLFDIRSKF